MQDLLNNILQIFSSNSDTISLSLATGFATILVFALKYIFIFAGRFASRTPTNIDDKIVSETKDIVKEKIKGL